MAKKEKLERFNFTVNRSKWLSGSIKEGPPSQLLATGYGACEGYMCCLGFLAKACGVSDKKMVDESTPACLPKQFKKSSRILKSPLGRLIEKDDSIDPKDPFANTKLCNSIMGTNDSTRLSSKKREQKLKEQFAKLNIHVKFED